MSDKSDAWKEAKTRKLVKGNVNCKAYRETNVEKLQALLQEHENELFKPKVTKTTGGEKPESINVQQQNENKLLMDKIAKLEKEKRSTQAENYMLSQKLDKLATKIESGASATELALLSRTEKVDEGPRILVKVLIDNYSIDGKVYSKDDEFLCPQNRFPTNSLEQLGPLKKIKKKK